MQRGYAVALGIMSATVGGFFPVTLSVLKYKIGGPKGRMGRRIVGFTLASRSSVHETVAVSSPSLQRDGSSTKAVTLLASSQGPVEVRAGVEAFFGEDGRAFELKAQSLSNPSLPSNIIVGCKLKGPLGLAQSLGGTMSSGKKGRSQREEDAARKGKAPVDQMRGFTQKEEMMVSKKMWITLFPPSVDRQQGHQSSSEPLFPLEIIVV
ncbi:hypothetical protein CK203_041401 [Vitis vinifera]|uniref:Uncharacterized protein n=1 Tax=Vitis vinifera TaxID=29760 RepID=A0A438H6C9_VITVI|nr:hypothetical protein CK203_041401 [Vitis vinifera]